MFNGLDEAVGFNGGKAEIFPDFGDGLAVKRIEVACV